MLVGVLAFVTSCGLLPGPRPDPSLTGPPVPLAPAHRCRRLTEFAPLTADATKGLGTGANDFDTGLAASGSTVVTSSIVYGNRLAPAFRLSTDAGATWQVGGLSEAGEAATPPDQGDQTDDVAVSTVGGALRWVALGSSWRQPLTWTSADGRRWDRHEPPADQIGPDDGPVELAAVPEGFVLVGTDARDRPAAWTSPDGVTWTPRRMPGKGSPASVTSKGSTVVAVGSSGDTYATWSSQDRGLTWKRGSKPPKPVDDGDFSRSLDDVTATDDGFTADRVLLRRRVAPGPLPLEDGQHLGADPRAAVREGGDRRRADTRGRRYRGGRHPGLRRPGPPAPLGPARSRLAGGQDPIARPDPTRSGRVVAGRPDPERRRVDRRGPAVPQRPGRLRAVAIRRRRSAPTPRSNDPRPSSTNPWRCPWLSCAAAARRWSSVTAGVDLWCGPGRAEPRPSGLPS